MSYESITLVLLFLGGTAVFWSYYGFNTTTVIQKKTKPEKMDNELYEEYGARIEELNHKILEINEYGGFLKGELDKKHKELLFLYQLIHEKTIEIKELKEQNYLKQQSTDIIQENNHRKIKDLEQKKLNNIKSKDNYNNSRAILSGSAKEKKETFFENEKEEGIDLISGKKQKNDNVEQELEFDQVFNEELSRKEKADKVNTNNDNSYKHVILELSEKGYSIIEIAQMLDIGQGEVQLVLDLYE